jgi:hemolysin III
VTGVDRLTGMDGPTDTVSREPGRGDSVRPEDAVQVNPEDAVQAVKPRLRGVFHEVAFFASLVSGAALIWAAPTTGSTLTMAVYAASISLLFGVSALFHRHTWGPKGRRRMRRADHSTIFIAIAGSYTAVAGIALTGWARTAVLCIVWGGAVAGIILRQLWLDAPKWVIALPYVVVGWAAVAVLPQLFRALGAGGFTLLLIGGLAYSAGAAVYALKRPNPAPGVFGYHEVFHACTIVGAVLHFVVIAWFVLPLAG